MQKQESNPAEMLSELTTRYASKSTSTKLILLKELINTNCSASKSIANQYVALICLVVSSRANDRRLSTGERSSIVLKGMSDYEPTIAALISMNDEKRTWELVNSRLIDKYNG